MEIQHIGIFLLKLAVPSKGSISQKVSPKSSLDFPLSSAKIGKDEFSVMMLFIKFSDSMSAFNLVSFELELSLRLYSDLLFINKFPDSFAAFFAKCISLLKFCNSI